MLVISVPLAECRIQKLAARSQKKKCMTDQTKSNAAANAKRRVHHNPQMGKTSSFDPK